MAVSLPHCIHCYTTIAENQPYWALCLHNETLDRNTITVREAHQMQLWCERCYCKFDFDRIVVPKKTGDGACPQPKV